MSTRRPWPVEPVLELDQIQGIAVPGFLKPQQTLLYAYHGNGEVPAVKAFLRQLAPTLSTGVQTLADRRSYRGAVAAGVQRAPLLAVGFTFPGLLKLTASAKGMRRDAFRHGLPARSSLLGDPRRSSNRGHPSQWVVGGPGNIPDFMLVIAGDDRGPVNAMATSMITRLDGAGISVVRQDGGKHGTAAKSREHFGFVDGISQPGIRGRASASRSDFITERHVDPSEWPAAAMYGYPGQDLVWPGEFVLGYPASGPDPLRPGPVAQPDLPWMRNGSYLVYNRLVQDVGEFWRTMRDEAKRLSQLPGFAGITDEELAARLVGRNLDGAPLSRLHHAPAWHEELARNPHANNHFRFDSDTPRVKLALGRDACPMARADPLGQVCPLASHIRKVNPRDAASDMGGESATYEHRILRVGVPFGPPRDDRYARDIPGEPDRGLLFLGIQASIEEQFEFLQARWMNDDRRPRAPSGHDLVGGRRPASGEPHRSCVIFGSGGQLARVESRFQFITPTGGGYFFVPSVDAIATTLAAEGINDAP